MSELLTKTHVLKPSKVRYLNTAFLAYLSEVELSHLTFASHLLRNDKVKHCHTKISTTVLLVALLASCKASPSYAEVGKSHFGGNSDFLTELNKISYLPSISEDFLLISNSDFVEELNKINHLPFKSDVRKHHIIASHYQPFNNHSFNYVDAVAVNGNNVKQELRNLFKSVQHHTIVDVFFCLSFIFLPFMGELRLAIALLALWWGGSGNKPFIRRIPLAVDLAVSNLPAALHLGQIIKTSQPLEKV